MDKKQLLHVLENISNGNLTKKLPLFHDGIDGQICACINKIISQQNDISNEFERLNRSISIDGKLSDKFDIGIGNQKGYLSDIQKNANSIIKNISEPLIKVNDTVKLISSGNLNEDFIMTNENGDYKGEIKNIGLEINHMLNGLRIFSKEINKVVKMVNIEGKLGGSIIIDNIYGIWTDIANDINNIVYNITEQVRSISEVTKAISIGDLSKKININVVGEMQELKDIINGLVDKMYTFSNEIVGVLDDINLRGKLDGQAIIPGAKGIWENIIAKFNTMISNTTKQFREVSGIVIAVSRGDLTKRFLEDGKGELKVIKDGMNDMMDKLNLFVSEMNIISKAVGVEGLLGKKIESRNMIGSWLDVTNNINLMISNLSNQIREIGSVIDAIGKGDLSKRIVLTFKGEMSSLSTTINEMIYTLDIFTDQVSNVARDVGIYGKLGSQAIVPGANGIWKDLTNNVNELASNLTNQVRSIETIASAVIEGDLSKTITVNANGEMNILKDKINQMIETLRNTTKKHMEQDWLKTNVAKFISIAQNEKTINALSNNILFSLIEQLKGCCGMFYVIDSIKDSGEYTAVLKSSYGCEVRHNLSNIFREGEGIIGQVLLEKKMISLSNVPNSYTKVLSGIGEGSPSAIVIFPILFENKVLAIIEIGTFNTFTESMYLLIKELSSSLGIVINNISINRTEELLKKSQKLAITLKNNKKNYLIKIKH